MTSALPELVEAEWLEANLEQPDLRILDATIQLGAGEGRTGRSDWERSHIPGSTFVDLVELSDPNSPTALTMPTTEWFERAIGRLGVGDDSRVVIYDSRESMWAARLWWMFHAFGFDEVAVLNGGWTAWQRGGYPVCDSPCGHPPTTFTARPRPGLVVSRDEVLAAIDEPNTCLINALGRRQHRGEVSDYGRPGHIPGSINVTAWEILDRETQRYRSPSELRKKFGSAFDAERIITYCGGGVACASDAFVLRQLGHRNVAIYDGGLLEWCANPELPLTTDED